MAQNNQQKGQDASQLEKVRREKLAELQAAGRDPFQIVKYDQTHHSEQIRRDFDSLENETVSIAGRMMFKRVMGKASATYRTRKAESRSTSPETTWAKRRIRISSAWISAISSA